MKSRQETNQESQDLFNTAEMLFNQEDYETAIYFYNEAISLNGGNIYSYYHIGIAFYNLEQYKDAIEAYFKAIKIDNSQADIYYNLGVAFDSLEQHEDAIEAYRQAISVDPTHPCSASAFCNMGVAFDSLGKYKDAIEAYRQATEINNNHANAYYNMGMSYDKLGASKEVVLGLCNKAIGITPDVDYLRSKAKILKDLSRNEEAEALENNILMLEIAEIDDGDLLALKELQDLVPNKSGVIECQSEKFEESKKQFHITNIVYSNKLLNHWDLAEKSVKQLGINKILDLSPRIDIELLDLAIQDGDQELVLAGLMSLDGEM